MQGDLNAGLGEQIGHTEGGDAMLVPAAQRHVVARFWDACCRTCVLLALRHRHGTRSCLLSTRSSAGIGRCTACTPTAPPDLPPCL